MTEIDRDMCRKAAAECIELARATTDLTKKEMLMLRAQEWIKLAYAKNDADFEKYVSEMNAGQMAPAQRQPLQQQQSKSEPDEDK
jgi:hypothetical protein